MVCIIQYVFKTFLWFQGDCKLVPAVSSAGLPALRPTTGTVNGNRKVAPAPPVPPLKVSGQKTTFPFRRSSVCINVKIRWIFHIRLHSIRNFFQIKEPSVPVASSTPIRLAPPLTTMTTSSPPPPMLPTPTATPPTPPMLNLQTSPPVPPSVIGPGIVSMDPNNPFSSLNMLPQPKIEVKQEQWSGDESYLEANGIRPRKPCNCTKSMCLKLLVFYVLLH